jgi:hypothetical protein
VHPELRSRKKQPRTISTDVVRHAGRAIFQSMHGSFIVLPLNSSFCRDPIDGLVQHPLTPQDGSITGNPRKYAYAGYPKSSRRGDYEPTTPLVEWSISLGVGERSIKR